MWGCSSVGRAPALQAGGQEFEPPQLHQHFYEGKLQLITIQIYYYYQYLPIYLRKPYPTRCSISSNNCRRLASRKYIYYFLKVYNLSMIEKFDAKSINSKFVKKLIDIQFPEYNNLEIKAVKKQGWDNRTYRLGKEKLIRLPSGEYYSEKIIKENKYLPKLAPHLTTKISKPLKLGKPSTIYPFNFAIYEWIEGKSANLMKFTDKELQIIAKDLSVFLNELHFIKNLKGPSPGKHNGWGGGELNFFDKDTQNQIENLKNIINKSKSLDLWKQAKSSKWNKKPVWIHGDFYFGNFLVHNNKLSGVIDFGGMAKGDPAKDLVIAWTFLKNESREIFKYKIKYDSDTWIRAKGWVLWKATFELCKTEDKNSEYAKSQKEIINDVIKDY